MSVETVALSAFREGEKVVAGALKEIWSALDAASEKQPPSEYLSPDGIAAMQAGLDETRPGA